MSPDINERFIYLIINMVLHQRRLIAMLKKKKPITIGGTFVSWVLKGYAILDSDLVDELDFTSDGVIETLVNKSKTEPKQGFAVQIHSRENPIEIKDSDFIAYNPRLRRPKSI
jgi:hypothetical protein